MWPRSKTLGTRAESGHCGWFRYPLHVICALIGVCLWTSDGAAQSAETGTSARIVIPPGAGKTQIEAAELLQDCIRSSTGVRIPITNQPGSGLTFHIGRSPYVDALQLDLQSLAPDGFVLKLQDARNYIIAGQTEDATQFGVCEFLERAIGVRWLQPGALWTDIPRQAQLALPPEEIRQKPAFESRVIFGLKTRDENLWWRRMRLNERLRISHNLHALFPPDELARDHPELYPVFAGQRYIPSEADQDWNPDFAAGKLAEIGATRIAAHFRQHPQQESFSLGVNDTNRLTELTGKTGARARRRNYLGLVHGSEEYYAWCNAVAQRLRGDFPDRFLTCYAYNNFIEPPDFPLEPALVPFLAMDRHVWADAEKAQQARALEQRWLERARHLAWYDYVYGGAYCLPRVYPRLMADYLRWGQEHGVRAITAEAYPNWAEGPKLYTYLKLLWNPDQDVEALLDDWYTRAVGPAAAPALKEYYAIWERFWTETAPRSDWWPERLRIYLPFSSPAYLAAVDEQNLRRCQDLLTQCVEQAETAIQERRAEQLRDGFAFYAASVYAYQAQQRVVESPLETEAQAIAAVADAALRLRMQEYRQKVIEPKRGHPVAQHFQSSMTRALRGEQWGTATAWRLFDWIGRSDQVRQRVSEWRQDESPLVRETGQALLAWDGGLSQPLTDDASFEADNRGPWLTWVQGGVGRMSWTDMQARTGRQSVLLDSMKLGGPHQALPIRPGRYVGIAHVLVPADSNFSGTVTLAPVLRDAADKNLTSPELKLTPVKGRWMRLACPVQAPPQVDGRRVAKIMLLLTVNDGQAGQVFVDDMALYRMP